MTPTAPSLDRWQYRRRIVFLSLAYIGVNVQYLVIRGGDTVLNQQIGLALVAAGVAIIMAYVFGAVIDDKFQIGTRED